MPSTGPHVFQHLIVGLRITSQELLDAGEDWGYYALSGHDKRLQAPAHAPVAVAERVDHRQVQMGHGGLHYDGIVSSTQLPKHRRDEAGYFPACWPLIDDLVGCFPVNEDRARPPASRIFLQVVLEHHEVKALEKALVDLEAVVGYLQDVGHRGPVAGESLLGLLFGAERGFFFHGSNDVIERGVVSLNAVGPLDRSGKRHSPQGPGPAPRLRHPIAQPLPLVSKQSENL